LKSEKPASPGNSILTTGLAFLNRRARNCPIRAIDAAISLQGLKNFSATFAVVKPLAGVCWHLVFFNMKAFRASYL